MLKVTWKCSSFTSCRQFITWGGGQRTWGLRPQPCWLSLPIAQLIWAKPGACQTWLGHQWVGSMLTEAETQSCFKAFIVLSDINSLFLFFPSTMDFFFSHLLEQRTFSLPDGSRLSVLEMCLLYVFSKLKSCGLQYTRGVSLQAAAALRHLLHYMDFLLYMPLVFHEGRNYLPLCIHLLGVCPMKELSKVAFKKLNSVPNMKLFSRY